MKGLSLLGQPQRLHSMQPITVVDDLDERTIAVGAGVA
jgi:hypothetical protein